MIVSHTFYFQNMYQIFFAETFQDSLYVIQGLCILCFAKSINSYHNMFVFTQIVDYDEPKGWWTAGNYIARNQRWMWTTKHHLKEITYNRWAPQEPNARSTMHCMLLYKNAAYRWHDATCSDKHNFICEIEIV